jgi:hypothetical protein
LLTCIKSVTIPGQASIPDSYSNEADFATLSSPSTAIRWIPYPSFATASISATSTTCETGD